MRKRLKVSFNPRPALASGATRPPNRPSVRKIVSIRAPLSRAGRPIATKTCPTVEVVSIRAPLSRAGRRVVPTVAAPVIVFQSAPRSRERGDDANTVGVTHSIAFQSAPRSRERGDIARSRTVCVGQCFNPRPALASGATPDANPGQGPRLVSIRAPLSRAGRPVPVSSSNASRWFQSAPRSRERGDGRSCGGL